MVLLKVGFVRYWRVRIDGPGPLAGVLNDRVWVVVLCYLKSK